MTCAKTDYRLEEGLKLIKNCEFSNAISVLEKGSKECEDKFDDCSDKGCGWCMEVHLPNLMKYHYNLGATYFKPDYGSHYM